MKTWSNNAVALSVKWVLMIQCHMSMYIGKQTKTKTKSRDKLVRVDIIWRSWRLLTRISIKGCAHWIKWTWSNFVILGEKPKTKSKSKSRDKSVIIWQSRRLLTPIQSKAMLIESSELGPKKLSWQLVNLARCWDCLIHWGACGTHEVTAIGLNQELSHLVCTCKLGVISSFESSSKLRCKS